MISLLELSLSMAKKHKYWQVFYFQRWAAARREIEFLLTFEEWLKIWEDSGFLHLRGKGKGKYCMARYGDIGAYEVSNVKIIPFCDNVSEGQKDKPKSQSHRDKIGAAGRKRIGEKRPPRTDVHRANLSTANMGHTVSAETRVKIGAANKGKRHPFTAEQRVASSQRALLREAKRRKLGLKTKRNPKLGEENNRSKFKTPQVLYIRSEYDSGQKSIRELADEFKVHYNSIMDIVKRNSWKHIA